ncbi:hypothetical protein CEXT_798751 [Caerostris extrusa]|uniref:Uncharacterized protein n=1 Tax=Caerostris extrusa TaxID=172846 RepID=A0AAV4MD61_CAEEX|nr:hypothetical protein CEXT_798751 [Caerostris extrusa]
MDLKTHTNNKTSFAGNHKSIEFREEPFTRKGRQWNRFVLVRVVRPLTVTRFSVDPEGLGGRNELRKKSLCNDHSSARSRDPSH